MSRNKLLVIGISLIMVSMTYNTQLFGFSSPHSNMEINDKLQLENLKNGILPRTFAKTKLSTTQYIERSPIVIQNNSDFLDQANKEGWIGLGTYESPIIISNYHIFNDSDNMVTIQDTTVHFRLINNSFDGNHSIWRCLYLVNVTNGQIYNNYLFNTSGIGLFSCENMSIHDNLFEQNFWISVYLDSSHNNLVFNNILTNGSFGIELDSSTKNHVSNNTILGVPWSILLENSSFNNVSFNFINKDMICNSGLVPDSYGILLEMSHDNLIFQNVITENCAGILVDSAANNTVMNNTLSENRYGIRLQGIETKTNLLLNNSVNSNKYGFYIHTSANTSIKFNKVFNSTYYGIIIWNSNNTLIQTNIFLDNYQYGIYLNSGVNSSIIKWNDFLGNQMGLISQAYDSGSHNIFDGNYWSTWVSPDIDENGIVDDPLTIDGMIGNSDQNPRIFVNSYHFLSPLTIITPNGGEVLNNTVTIHWQQVTDSYNHSVIYSIFCSPDNGINWNLLKNNLSTTSYEWNTTEFSNGEDYRIKIRALCSEGLCCEVISYSKFSVLNHILTIPTILSPLDGEFTNGYIFIEWIEVLDSWNHDVTYELFYSPNSETDWILLKAGLNVTYYDWDTTTVSNGFDYRIKVSAHCSKNLTSIYTSNSSFTILNHVLSIPTVISPNGGEIISGTVILKWQAVTDSWNHSITYKVYYSLDGGVSMHLIASDIMVTYLDWNTTSVDNSDHYIIKVYAFCSDGLSTDDVSDSTFMVKNPIDQPTTIPRKTSFMPFYLFLLPLIILAQRKKNFT